MKLYDDWISFTTFLVCTDKYLNIISMQEEHQSTGNIQTPPVTPVSDNVVIMDTTIDLDKLEPVQEEPCFLYKMLCLHYMATVYHYLWNGVNNKTLLKYRPTYDQFITTTRIRDIVIEKYVAGEPFNLFTSALSTQTSALVVIFILAMVVGATTTVLVYFQQVFVKQIINQQRGETYKFFGIIVVLIFARLILYNYLIALTNNVAHNIKISLENYYMRLIFMVDNQEIHNKIHKFRFLDIQSITEGVGLISYLFASFFTISGIIILIFILSGLHGFIVLGMFCIFLIFMAIVLKITYRELLVRDKEKTDLIKEDKYLFQSLLKMLQENLTEKLLKSYLGKKEHSLSQDKLVNRAYSFMQLAADSTIVIPIIIFYSFSHNGTSSLTLQQIYLTAVYLTITYFPVKLLVYGCFYMVRTAIHYHQLINDMNIYNKKTMKDLNQNVYSLNRHCYADDIGSCFDYQYDLFYAPRFVSRGSLMVELQHKLKGIPFTKKHSPRPMYDLLALAGQDNNILLCCMIQNESQMYEFVYDLSKQIPKDKTQVTINKNYFLLPQNVRQNIALYSQVLPEDQKEMKRILQLVYLWEFVDKIGADDPTILSTALAKMQTWHAARLQLARALYQNVDFLIVDHFSLIQDTNLMIKVLQERNRKNKVTLLIDRTNFSLLKHCDRTLLFLPGISEPQINTFDQIMEGHSQNWVKIFQKMSQQEIQFQMDHQHLYEQLLNPQKTEVKVIASRNTMYNEFFGLVHPGGIFVVFAFLIAPAALKFYISYLIGTSLTNDIFQEVLIIGICYLVMIFLRGMIMSGYLKAASKQIFINLIDTYCQLTGTQILKMYRSHDVSIEANFSQIDNHFLMSFELGVTGILDNCISVLVFSFARPLFLFVGIPIFLITFLNSRFFGGLNRSITSLRQQHVSSIKNYVKFCTIHCSQLLGYHKYEQIEKRFHQLNRLSALFESNMMWVFSGMRMQGELILTLGFVIFLFVIIQLDFTQEGRSMVGLGVSMFLTISLTYRFNIKAAQTMERQLLAITKIHNFIQKKNNQPEAPQEGHSTMKVHPADIEPTSVNLQHLEYRNVSIRHQNLNVQNINFILKKGDRVAVSCDSRNIAAGIFLPLNYKLVDQSQHSGDIIVNKTIPLEQIKLKVFHLFSNPILPRGTILQLCQLFKEDLNGEQLTQNLKDFFKKIDIPEIFDLNTRVGKLSPGHQQILNIFKTVYYHPCDVLVCINGVSDVDMVTRKKIHKFLVDSTIPIIISVTNFKTVIKVYPRHFSLSDFKLTIDRQLAPVKAPPRRSRVPEPEPEPGSSAKLKPQ